MLGEIGYQMDRQKAEITVRAPCSESRDVTWNHRLEVVHIECVPEEAFVNRDGDAARRSVVNGGEVVMVMWKFPSQCSQVELRAVGLLAGDDLVSAAQALE